MAYQFQSHLRQHPDIAAKIAYVIADYTLIEFMLLHIYIVVSKHEPKQCVSEFFSRRSVKKRQELVFAETADVLDAEHHRALARLWKRAKAASNRRTEIAHCFFLPGENVLKRMRIISGQPKYDVLDDRVFDRTWDQYRNLQQDLATFLLGLLPAEAVEETVRQSAIALGLPIPGQNGGNHRPIVLPTAPEIEESRKRLGLP